jgi:hypothetical protein
METVFDVVKRVLFITYELGRFVLVVLGGMLFGAFSRDRDDEYIVENVIDAQVFVERGGEEMTVSRSEVMSSDHILGGRV